MTAIDLPHRTLATFARADGDGSAAVGRWAMMLFLLNEATLFACLVASYFYLAFENREWPPPGVAPPTLRLPLIMTVALLSSSAVVVLAESAFKRGRSALYRAGTLGAAALGGVFLMLQAIEYRDKLSRLHPSDSSYASLFYTITGLHGTHVAFGVLLLLWALLREMKGTARAPRSLAISNASLYWHFVDGVWLVILTSLYLSPRWS